MDKLYRYSSWVVLSLSLLGYLFYQILVFNGSITNAINDIQTWVHLGFVVYVNVTMAGASFDSGTSWGLLSDEFKLADELNNKIIKSVNNEMDTFRTFVKKLNESELKTIQDDYLFSVGDKKVEELTPKQKRTYDRLKPIQHNVYGFNLPLYYEMSRNGKVKYQASIKRNQGKLWIKLNRGLSGLLFGAMTVNMIVSFENIGSALTSLMVIMVGLGLTFIMISMPQMFKLRYNIPQKVILKKTLYDSYIEYKNGTHTLVKHELNEKSTQ